MREIKMPRIEREPVELEITPSEEFIADLTNFKSVHFLSRSGIAQPKQDIPSFFLRRNPDAGNTPEGRRKILREMNRGESTVSKFVTSLHSAFARHIPFSISPIVLMNIVSQEIAQYVKDHSEDLAVATLFTRNPGQKEKLVVEVNDFTYGSAANDWLAGISKFRDLLSSRVPSEILGHMTPRFSEATMETEVSHLVSFMDAASKYYSYGMSTMCGIPEFRIEGTPDDWNVLVRFVSQMRTHLPGLEIYFDNLIPILTQIRETADGNKVDNGFWASIYKENNESGGPYSNGWFNNLYAHVYSQDWNTKKSIVILKEKGRSSFGGTKLNQFPSNLSVVEFEWNYYGNMIPMTFVGGVTSVEYTDGFLTPRLGVAVLERNP